MTERVKTRRPYRSELRAELAAGTRQRILESARTAFLRTGYPTTSLADIAAAAGVSLPTVKAVFGTKPRLLLQVWHRCLADADDAIPVHQREWFTDALAAVDAATVLQLVARNSAVVKPRIAPLITVIEGAAPVDPAIAELWRQMQQEFHAVQRRIVAELDRRRVLAPDLTVGEATDILWTLNHHEPFLLLTRDRRWPVARYERWLARTLVQQLLIPTQ